MGGKSSKPKLTQQEKHANLMAQELAKAAAIKNKRDTERREKESAAQVISTELEAEKWNGTTRTEGVERTSRPTPCPHA